MAGAAEAAQTNLSHLMLTSVALTAVIYPMSYQWRVFGLLFFLAVGQHLQNRNQRCAIDNLQVCLKIYLPSKYCYSHFVNHCHSKGKVYNKGFSQQKDVVIS